MEKILLEYLFPFGTVTFLSRKSYTGNPLDWWDGRAVTPSTKTYSSLGQRVVPVSEERRINYIGKGDNAAAAIFFVFLRLPITELPLDDDIDTTTMTCYLARSVFANEK